MVVHADNANSQDGYGPSGGEWGSYWSPGWGPPNAPLPPHQHHTQQLPNWTSPGGAERKEGAGSFDYGGHMHGNHGYAAQTYDYNHGTDHIGLTQGQGQGVEHGQFNQYWAQSGPGAPPFLRRDMNDFVDQVGPTEEDDLNAIPALDAAKRKNLPAWIRDGLEKMERDKQKQLDREEMLRQRELRLHAQREEDERAVREFHARRGQDGDGDRDQVEQVAVVAVPTRSKFESDSDDETNDEAGSGESRPESPRSTHRSSKPSTSLKTRTTSPVPFEAPPKTEQERMEEMMIKVRRLLTEILLEVTNEEIGWIANEVFSKARAKGIVSDPSLSLSSFISFTSLQTQKLFRNAQNCNTFTLERERDRVISILDRAIRALFPTETDAKTKTKNKNGFRFGPRSLHCLLLLLISFLDSFIENVCLMCIVVYVCACVCACLAKKLQLGS